MNRFSTRWIGFFFAFAGVALGVLPGFVVASFAAGAASDDLSSISLIDVEHYNPSQSSSIVRGSKGIFSSILTGVADRMVRSEIESAVRDAVEGSAEIKAYFSASEREVLVQRVLAGVGERLSDSHDDFDFVSALKYLGNDLIGSVVDRAMEKEGISSAETRAAWREKLLSGFNQCTSVSITIFEAQSCLDSLKAGLPHNLGLALTHSMTRELLAASLSDTVLKDGLERDLDRRYRNCVGDSLDGGSRVKNCVVGAIRTGVLTVSDLSLRQKLESVFPKDRRSQDSVRNQVLPAYQLCISQKSDSAGFYSCIDDLSIKAGGAAVEQKIVLEPSVASAVKSTQARAKLAADERRAFERCGDEQKAKGVRSNGMLSTTRCENLVENRVTFVVLQRSFQASADENLGPNDPAEQGILDETNAKLKACWSDDMTSEKRQNCVRAGVATLAHLTTARVLDQKVPPQVFGARKGWKESLLSDYDTCLNENLPSDIVHSPERDRVLDRCSGVLRKKAGMVVADEQVRTSFRGKLSDGQLKELLDKQVSGKFSSCLGEMPGRSALDSCSVTLTRDAAKYAGHIILPAELHNVVNSSSKPVSERSKVELADFSDKTVQALDTCLDQKVVLARVDSASKDAESCFKVASHDSALFIGRMQFDWETGDFYAGQEEKWNAVRSDFLTYLTGCIENDASPDMALDAYLMRIHECGDKASLRVTSRVGEDQVESALAVYLKDTPSLDFSKQRADLRRKLVGDFKGCMSQVLPGDNPSRMACTEELQRSATESVGLTVGRAHVAEQLGSKPRPEMKKIEAELHSCVEDAPTGAKLSPSLDSCMKKYTLSLASSVADSKMKSTLASALGSVEYANALPEVGKALASYRACLSQLEPLPLGKDFMSGLDRCAADLTARARGIIQARVRNWFGNPAGTDPSSSARIMLIDAIPCLDGLMSTPEDDIQQAGVDPAGTLRAMVSLLKTYVDYDSVKAQGDVKAMIARLQKDLQSVGPDEARRDLVKLLEERHVLDQVIKSMVQSEAVNSLSQLPEDQKLSKAVMAQLTKKDVFDKIFSGPQGAQIMKKAMDEIVRPALVENKSMQDPALVKAKDTLTRDIKNLLADSPDFGTVVIQASVQKQMDDLDGISRFFARVLYGKDALDWSKARLKPQGRAAEEYIRENILKPQIQGDPIATDEMKSRMKKAKELVTQAATS